MWNFIEKLNPNYLLFLSISVVCAYFRFTFLGYSDLQGDEAKIFLYSNSDSFINFLLSNSKGPGQYVVTKFIDLLSINFLDIEFLFRFPFAFASFLSGLLFFYISKKFYNTQIGIYVFLFASLNGLFIAFARIIQYQSFNIFFGLLSSLFFLFYLKKQNYKYLIASGLLSSIALLFHYDALGFILPQLILLFANNNRLKTYAIYFGGFLTSLIFYIPYFLSDSFMLTFKYLVNDRAISNFSYDSVFYSLKLSNIYFSKEYLVIILVLAGLALWKLKANRPVLLKVLLLGLFITLVARYFVGHPYKPLTLLSLLLSGGIFLQVFMADRISKVHKYFYLWFLVTFTVYILFINKPLTHIYNVFIPLTFLAGYQLYKIKSKIIKFGIIALLFVSAVSFNYHAYIESYTEYPWVSEKYIFGEMYQGISEGEVVRGIFGFPYYRALDDLGGDLKSLIPQNVKPAFYSNIKLSRLDFYINQDYPLDGNFKRYYIDVKDDRDYEEEDSVLLNSPKEVLLERHFYTIYKVL